MAEITDDIRALLLDPEFPDAEIAEIAGIHVEEVPKLRLWAGLADTVKAFDDTAGPAVEATEPAPEPTKPAKGKTKAAKPGPAEEAPPSAVRVTKRGGSTAAPSGVIGLRPGIVYRGADAAHLWQHHRDKVTPYPAR